ncbi:hypothetical protein BDN70DRAFT_862120 [Pholiota conissans]|uniref:Uncharacterized protein n=1 Tax=Pholiota conissans TaxID=109636 RepID=A0A9P5YZ22_9AGAR|nr:hypothetical protein BDN70DRAFT_862120 [Pholiota conissans]
MPSSIGLDSVTLVSIFVEAILYGLFTALFVASTFILLRKFRRPKHISNKPLLIASFTMFILATVHIGTDLRRLMDAFLRSPDPVAALGQVNTPISLLKNTTYALQTLVGDAFILYRLYLVWNGDKRVVVPILICFVASIGVGIGALQAFAKAAPDALVFIVSLEHWIVSFFALTLFTNLCSTFLIACRTWWVHRRTRGIMKSGENVLPAMVLIIESGSIYSACLIILLVLYLSGSFAQYILLDAVTQVIGVVFTLVIVRVALGISTETVKTPSMNKSTTFRVSDMGGRSTDNSDAYLESNINMKPLNVKKTVEIVEYV